MGSFLAFTVITSFILVAIVSSATIPPKKYSAEPTKPAPTEFQFLIELLCRINKLEAEAKEIQSEYLQLLHDGLHVPEDKVLALNVSAGDLEEPEPILGTPHHSGAESWVRAAVRPLNSFGYNRNATGKRSIPVNKTKFSKFRLQ